MFRTSQNRIPRGSVVLEILPHNDIYGGVKSVNKIVNLLNGHHREAYVCTPGGKPARWLVHPASCLSWEEAQKRVKPSDILIFNWMPDLDHFRTPGNYIIHARDRFQDFRSSRVTNYWAVTPSVEKYLRGLGIGGEIGICTTYVDTSVFKPREKIARSVAYMLRRGFEFIRPIVERRADITWLWIENEPELRVAELLGNAELFLYPTMGTGKGTETTKSEEAFGNPGLEAMACGAVLLSFEFESVYLTQDNHLTIVPDDIESKLDYILSHPTLLMAMRTAGLNTAARWNEEQVWLQLRRCLNKCAKGSSPSNA